MKIYHNEKYLSKLKRFIAKSNNDYLNTLIGINLIESEMGELHVYPVYRSIRLLRLPDGKLIEFPLGKKSLVLIIRKFRINFFILNAEVTDISDVGKTNE